jgi:hypothetical protein
MKSDEQGVDDITDEYQTAGKNHLTKIPCIKRCNIVWSIPGLKYGLVVDELTIRGNRCETSWKTYKDCKAYAGATIMGDGALRSSLMLQEFLKCTADLNGWNKRAVQSQRNRG